MKQGWKTALPWLTACVIAVLTLTPAGGVPTPSGLTLDIDSWRGVADILINIALFAPLGVALAIATPRTIPAIVAGALFSLAIEAFQLVVPGRYSSFVDLFFNTLGTIVGIALVRSKRHWLDVPLDRSSAHAFSALIAALLIAIGGAWLLQPAIPAPATSFIVEWTPAIPTLVRYHGSVLEARTGNLRLPHGPVANGNMLHNALVQGAAFHVRMVTGRSSGGLAPIFLVYDEAEREVMLFAADGDDAILRVRARSRDLRLDHAYYRFESALPAQTGDTIRVVFGREDNAWCLRTRNYAQCQPLHSPGRTWSLLVAPRLSPAVYFAIDHAWLVLLFLPAGFWLRQARFGAAVSIFAAIIILITPAWLWSGPILIGEAAAAGAGVWLGSFTRLLRRTAPGQARTGEIQ